MGRRQWAACGRRGGIWWSDDDGLTDSKKLSKKRRDELNVLIREQAAGYALGWVTSQEIDEVGLSEALRLATRRAVSK